MTTYLVKRLLLMIPTLFGVSLVVWIVLSLAPKPPIEAQAPSEEAGEDASRGESLSEATRIFRAQYNLDKPAILNFYFKVDPADVRRALTTAYGLDKEYKVAQKVRARERLIEWGYYAVPALLGILESSDGKLRDVTLSWTIQLATRSALIPLGGRVDPVTAAQNAEIKAENEMLRSFGWKASDSEARKQAGIRAFHTWLDGARAAYPDPVPTDEVLAALASDDRGKFGEWGPRAVAGLVEIVMNDRFRRTAAVNQLTASAQQAPPSDPVGAEAVKLSNAVVRRLAWRKGASDPQRSAGVEFVRTWWEGAGSRWDYGEGRWLKVMFLETRFATYWSNLLQGDLGISTVHRRPVLELILSRMKYSLALAVPSLLLSFIIAVPLGLLSATIHGTWSEKSIALVVFALYSLPSFFVATIVIRYFAEGQPGSLEWIPPAGFEDERAWMLTTWDRFKDIMWHIAAPLFCMTYASFAALSRYAKGGLMNVIRSDYVRTARAKGLSEFSVIMKHAARNGIIPVITLLGTTLPVVVGGSVIIEQIFTIEGMGRLFFLAVLDNDMPVVVGNTLIVATLVMIGILLSDLLYAVADPRISFK